MPSFDEMGRLKSAGRTESPAGAASQLIFNASYGPFLTPVNGFRNLNVYRKRTRFRKSGFRKRFRGDAMSVQMLDLPFRLKAIRYPCVRPCSLYPIRSTSQPDFVRNLASCVLSVMQTNELVVSQKGFHALFVASQGLHSV